MKTLTGWDSERDVRVETGIPGAVVGVIRDGDGYYAEVNGAGSVVAHVFPHGLEDAPESPAAKVERLTAELKEARKELKTVQSQ